METAEAANDPELSSARHSEEVARGERFEFGENWRRFLGVLDEDRIREAERSLQEMLGVDRLDGSSFLDVGCGSGLFSLAAHRLGARVHSFDFDPASVACAEELRRRFAACSEISWTIEQGSALDGAYLASLGQWDIVYSWGVLHHTGSMWRALDNVASPVAPGGQLFISIYNDQGRRSSWWLRVKRIYNALPPRLRLPWALLVMIPREFLSFCNYASSCNALGYVRTWTQDKGSRGMSRWHDLIDWVGGYPFEVAAPHEIFDFYRARGFILEGLITTRGGLGCNQYVFRRPADASDPATA